MISKKLNLTVFRGFHSKQENEIAGRADSYKRTGKYNCFTVEIEKTGENYFLIVRGSLHKYYHSNNAGQFLGSEVMKAKAELCRYFQVQESDCEVLNLEIGINILVWFEVYNYLKNNLIGHKKELFQDMPGNPKRIGFVAVHEDYLIKLYQKLMDLLRYEYKLKSKKRVNRAGIYTLADINESHINSLADDLLLQWKEVISRDGLNVYDKSGRYDQLTSKEREKVLEFTSIAFIQSYHQRLKLAKTITQGNQLRQEAYRLKQACLKIIGTYGNGDHKKLYGMMINEVEYFKKSWKGKGEIVTEHALVNTGKRDKGNSTIDSKIASKLKINMSNTASSKKQQAKEKREGKKLKINSFMNKLKGVLEELEAVGVPVKKQKIAA